MRRTLQAHLEASPRYDVGLLLARLAPTQLWKEQVIMHTKARIPRHSACSIFCIAECAALFHLNRMRTSGSIYDPRHTYAQMI